MPSRLHHLSHSAFRLRFPALAAHMMLQQQYPEAGASRRSVDALLSAMPDKADATAAIAAAAADEAAVDWKQQVTMPTTAAAPDCAAIDHTVVVSAEERGITQCFGFVKYLKYSTC